MKIHINKLTLKNIVILLVYFILMWILFGWTKDTPDYFNYANRFYSGTMSFGEHGFSLLINIIKKFGVTDFQEFLKVLSFIYLFCLFGIVKKYSFECNYPLALFLVYPFIPFCSGLRFAIAFLFIIIAILIYLGNMKFKKVFFISVIIIASSFHYSALFFLILLISETSIKLKQQVIITITMCSILAALTYTSFYYNILFLIASDSNKVMNNVLVHARFGFILPVIFQIISFFIFTFAYNHSRSVHNRLLINPRLLYKLNICGLYIIPLYFITSLFIRLYYPFLFINTLFYSEILFLLKFNNIKQKLKLLNFGQYMYLFITNVLIKEHVWLPFFTSNEFITPLLR